MLKTRTIQAIIVAVAATAMIGGASYAASSTQGLSLEAGGVRVTLKVDTKTGLALSFTPAETNLVTSRELPL